MIAETPSPPYYAVVFTSLLSEDTDGYAEMADLMVNLASKQPGYLGIESARTDLGITVSYWRDLASIAAWKSDMDHKKAQRFGREKWYAAYRIRVAKVEKEYGM